MKSPLLITHQVIVTLFLLHYILKLVLLLANRKEQLARYTAMMRIPEIIVSIGFLVTGVWMIIGGSILNGLMIAKLVCVFASIPLAVVGFKKGNKVLATLSVFLVLAAYGLAEMGHKAKAGGKVDTTAVSGDPIAVGKQVYANSCIACHGPDGNLGTNGAKPLSTTQLTADQQKDLIRNGLNMMPAHKELTDEQVDAVVQYIATFKQ